MSAQVLITRPCAPSSGAQGAASPSSHRTAEEGSFSRVPAAAGHARYLKPPSNDDEEDTSHARNGLGMPAGIHARPAPTTHTGPGAQVRVAPSSAQAGRRRAACAAQERHVERSPTLLPRPAHASSRRCTPQEHRPRTQAGGGAQVRSSPRRWSTACVPQSHVDYMDLSTASRMPLLSQNRERKQRAGLSPNKWGSRDNQARLADKPGSM